MPLWRAPGQDLSLTSEDFRPCENIEMSSEAYKQSQEKLKRSGLIGEKEFLQWLKIFLSGSL
jgi:hypothetical protein